MPFDPNADYSAAAVTSSSGFDPNADYAAVAPKPSDFAKRRQGDKRERWDILGDTYGQMAKSVGELKADLPKLDANARAKKGEMISAGDVAAIPVDFAKVAASPVIGAGRSTLANILAYAEPGVDRVGGTLLKPKIGEVDKLTQAEGDINSVADRLSLAAAPERMAGLAGEVKNLRGLGDIARTEEKATSRVKEAFGQNAAEGGATIEEGADRLAKAKGPLAPIDIGGDAVWDLAKEVSAETKPVANTLKTFLNARGADKAAAGDRLATAIEENISSGPSVKRTKEALAEDRAKIANPLYAESFEPRSVAPSETQRQNAVKREADAVEAAGKRLTKANNHLTDMLARRAQVGETVGDTENITGGLAPKRNAQFEEEMLDTQQVLKDAEAEKAAAQVELNFANARHARAKEALNESQAAAEAGAPGAVWSPRLEELRKSSYVRPGRSLGLKLMREEGIMNGEPINPTDFGIKVNDQGIMEVDAQGDPIVHHLANMRLLNAEYKGMGEMFFNDPKFRDQLTGRLTEEGRILGGIRHKFAEEIDAINADAEGNSAWKSARAAWSGPTQSMKAAEWGKKILNDKMPLEDAVDFMRDVDETAPGDRQFILRGLADAMKEKALSKGISAKQFKDLGRNSANSAIKEKVRAVIGDDAKFHDFVDMVSDEIEIAASGKLAKRLGAQEEPTSVLGTVAKALDQALRVTGHGISSYARHPIATTHDIIGSMLAPNTDKVNSSIARLLTDPTALSRLNVGGGQEFLSNAGQLPKTGGMMKKLFPQQVDPRTLGGSTSGAPPNPFESVSAPQDPVTSNWNSYGDTGSYGGKKNDYRYVLKHVGEPGLGGVVNSKEPGTSGEIWDKPIGTFTFPSGVKAKLVQGFNSEISAWANGKDIRGPKPDYDPKEPWKSSGWEDSAKHWYQIGTAKLDKGKLEHIIVAPSFRGQGLAKRLLGEAVQRLGADIFGAAGRSEQGAGLLEHIRQQILKGQKPKG